MTKANENAADSAGHDAHVGTALECYFTLVATATIKLAANVSVNN